VTVVADSIRTIWHELTLFASIGFVVGGVDDAVVDLLWIGRWAWREIGVYRRHDRSTAATLNAPTQHGRLIVFVPAWQEADVIGPMLRQCLKRWNGHDFRIYVGCYPNDAATRNSVLAVDSTHVRLVDCAVPGPTTKADCLNALWRALVRDEVAQGFRAKAVILHDAEDLVHPDELTLYQSLIDRFSMIQIPVEPLVDAQSRWIAGHYLDEFAEAHAKDMIVREAIGGSVPSAGVGSAIARHVLEHLASQQGGRPFDSESLTEDYELGLKLSALSPRSAFVRLPASDGRGLVAVKAQFPSALDEAVRQKTRWITGIALAGWDRMGWSGGLVERWMRMRDRRSILSAIFLTAGYFALILYVTALFGGISIRANEGMLAVLIPLSISFFAWRAVVRCTCVTSLYGWREGVRSIPRMIVGNIIAIMAARRAVIQYLRFLRTGTQAWDKTRHAFPSLEVD
jgi:bacteriophage N4 adsorption protein B